MPVMRCTTLAGLHILMTEVIKYSKMLAAINRRIEAACTTVTTALAMAYFAGLKQIADGQAQFDALKEVFRNRIIPLPGGVFLRGLAKNPFGVGGQPKPTSAQFIESPDHG